MLEWMVTERVFLVEGTECEGFLCLDDKMTAFLELLAIT